MIDLFDLPTSAYEIQRINLKDVSPLEGIESIAISIISFEGKSFSFNFNSKEEVLEGLSMACESLCNGAAYQIEDSNMKGTPILYQSAHNLQHIFHNGTYKLIREKISGECLFNTQSSYQTESIDESFLRKYENPFEVNLHREALAALDHTNFGELFFECSDSSSTRVKVIFARIDRKRSEFQIFSRKNIIKRIQISSIQSILPGIQSENIRKFLSNRFSKTSLTVVYNHQGIIFRDTKQLTLTFRTERQYDLWTAGLIAAVAIQKRELLSKKQLLQHSRLFNRFLNANQFQLADSFFNNSAIYQEYLTKEGSDYLTYESTLLHNRIAFCLEKQIDELKNEINTFKTSSPALNVSRDLKQIIDVFFDNISKISQQQIKQITQMKEIIEELQRAKVSAVITKDLLEIEPESSIDRTQQQNDGETERQQQLESRARKIKYFYQEIFKFQYRLDQSNLLLTYFNKPPKK